MATTTNDISRPFISGWSSHPIPNFSLSASGLLVLADLSTIAQRTVLRGGSSWLDSLLLAPGLHYQQAADDLVRGDNAQVLTAVEIGRDGRPTAHRIVNQAVVSYVLRIAKDGKTVVLDVGEIPVKRGSWGMRRQGMGRGGQRAMLYGGSKELKESLGWAAQLLYVASPMLTCVAIAFVVLLEDWWALAIIGILMVSRILNIAVIKSRSKPKPPHLPKPFSFPDSLPPPPRFSQYTITLNPTTAVILRGLSSDLYALTTTVWLRPKTHVEGYLEAIAKVLVYLVAAVSGNATQAGNIVLLLLLLVSAGLLALSNAQQQGLLNGGRVVAPSPGERENEYGRTWPRADNHHGHGENNGGVADPGRMASGRRDTESWPGSSDLSSVEDSLEKGPVGGATRRAFPSDDSLEYEVRLDTRAGTVEVTALRGR
ncbi:hypothetical protein N0V93_009187 [Gnomoniopsis smithogilvyi]|uniref:Uncharacterized protein n=1 Tax=Gnomoniopsis smithogilvyi TaxID=1191159 RepID=A0A9W9CTK0_9PEZI|nr:hypothetical protein N0V93_009187 [Gnomoniopsis smithogilvyi]